VHLVTCGHFRSHDNNGGHTIRSAISKNPMLHANFVTLCFIEPKLLPIAVLHCDNKDFLLFCSCDLDLDPINFIYKHDPYSLEIYWMCKYELPCQCFAKLFLTDRQTDRHQTWQTDTIQIYRVIKNSETGKQSWLGHTPVCWWMESANHERLALISLYCVLWLVCKVFLTAASADAGLAILPG